LEEVGNFWKRKEFGGLRKVNFSNSNWNLDWAKRLEPFWNYWLGNHFKEFYFKNFLKVNSQGRPLDYLGGKLGQIWIGHLKIAYWRNWAGEIEGN